MKQLRSRKRSQQWIAVLLAVVMVVGHMAMASAYDPNAGDTNVPILDLTMGGGVSGDGGVGDGSGTGGNGVISGNSDGEFVYDLTEGTIINDPTQQGDGQGDGEDEFVLDPENFNAPDAPDAEDFEVLFSVYPDRVLENGEIAEVRLTISSTGGENSRIPPDTKITIEFPSFIPRDSLESAAAELASATRNHVIKDNYTIVGGTGERKTLTMYTNELTGDNTWMIALLMRLRIDKYYYNGDNSVVISVGNSTSTGEIHVDEGNIGEDLFVRKELLNAKESFGNKYIDGAVGKYMVDIQLPKLVNTVDDDGNPMMVTITDQVQNPKFMLCTEDGEFDAAAIEAELRAAIIAGLMASTLGMTQDEANAIIHSFKFVPEGSSTPSGFEVKLIGETDAPVKIKLFYYFTAIDPSTITSNEFIRNEVRVTYGEFEVKDDVEVLANDTAAALWRKSINDGQLAMLLNENGLVPLPTSGSADVTFEFLITALGSPGVSKGQIIVDDYLDPEFIYKGSEVHSGTLEQYAALFSDAHTPLVDTAIGVYGNKLDPANRLVKIASNKKGSLIATHTTVTFTTEMDLGQILPGASGKNKVGGDVVYVYREAELAVGKTWQTATGDDVKSDVVFELYNKNGVLVGSATLTQDQMNNGETARIRFSYLTDSILDGVNAYTLKEKLEDEENSTYASAPDQTIYIEKYTDDVNYKRGVRFTDANGTPIGEYHGLHETVFENPYDDGLGKIAFAKYGKKKQGGMELLDGAEFTIHMGVATAYDANGRPTAVDESSLIPVNVTGTDGNYTYASVGGEGSVLKTDGGIAKIAELPYKVTQGEAVYDTYVIREKTPPADYDYDATKTLYYKLGKNNKNDERTDHSSSANYFLNNFYEDGQISITKVGEEDENGRKKTLEGAQFTLTRGTLEGGVFTPEPGFNAIVAPRNGTGEDGVATFTGLTNGLYEIKETKAPFGYKDFGGAIYVTIDHAGNASIAAIIKTDGTVEYTDPAVELKGKTITLTWENEVRYGWIEFTKVDKTSKTPLAGATFALYKTDGNFQNRVAYMIDDGNGGEVHYKITTNNAGVVKFEPLRFGYYIVVEESTDIEHFIPDDMKEIRFFVNDEAAATPGVDIGIPGNYQWPNPKRGRIEFTKVDWEKEDTTLEGAEFTLYKLVNGEPVLYVYESAEYGVNPVTTGTDGVVKFEKLPHGNYRVVETGAPNDSGDIKYYWDADNMPSVDFEVTETNFSVIGTTPGHYGNKLWRNPRLGEITFMKVDSAGKPLEGAVFTLERKTGPNSWVDVATFGPTDKTGVVTFKDLPHGEYRVKESTAPTGYFGNVTEVTFTVGRTTTSNPALDAPGGTMRWVNLKKGSIEFFKVDERRSGSTWVNLPGAEFTLYSVTGSGASERATEITTVTSGANGRVFFDELDHGTYKVVETKAPAGFMIDDKNPPTVYFQVGETSSVIAGRGNASLTDGSYWLNTPRKGSIVVQKYDLVDPSNPESLVTKPLRGVTFRLYRDVDGTAVWTGQEITTDAAGKAEFVGLDGNGLLAGTYYIVETNVPAGYEKDPRYADITEAMKHPIVLGVIDEETEVWLTTVEVTNPRVLKDLTFIKGDETTAGVLAGAKFALTSTSTLNGVSITREAVSGADGKVTFKDVPYGIYTLTETEPPKGYAPIAPITGIVVNDTVTGNAKDLGRINDYPYELIVTKSNLEPGETQTTYLPDAEFQIYVEIDSVKHYVKATPPTTTPGGGTPESIYVYEELTTSVSEATTFVTDANGKFVVEKMAYQTNKYWIVETKAPENFVIDTTPREVLFNEASNGAVIVKMVDVPNGAVRGGLEITKVDGTNNAPLSGVVFEVKRQGAADGEELILTTGADGKASANNLLYGTYEIREVKTRRGYKAMLLDEAGNEVDVLTVEITENGVTVKVKTIENYPVVGKVGLLKQGQTLDNGYEPLEGAQFLLKPITLTWDEEAGSVTNAVVSTNRSTFRYENSGADGSVMFEDLAYGAYIIEESMYAEGYEDGEAQPYVVVQVGLTQDEFTSLQEWFEANYSEEEYEKLRFEYRAWEGEEIPPITWRNRLVFGSLSFLKTDGDGSPLSEALFELYWIDGNNNDALVPVTLTKTEDGVFLFEGLNGTATEINTNTAGKGYIGELPYGRYTLRETKAPDNHKIEQEYHDFFVYGGHKNVSLTVKNPECAGTLRVIKKDATSENIFLSGAVVSVYHENDEGQPGKLFGTVETQIGGTGYLHGLPAGKYIAIETKAPDGYSLNAVNSKAFEITSENIDEQVSMELTYENTPISYSMRILKVELDESGNKVPVKVAGAEFLVNNSTGGYWYPRTNAEGVAELTGIPAGNYTVQETKAPAGYVRDDTVYNVTVNNEEETVEISIVNEKILGGVRIRKVDKDETVIEGAKFALYAEGSTEPMKLRATGTNSYVPDENGTVTEITVGEATITELPAGTYRLVETVVPDDYIKLDEERVFTITDQNYQALVEVDVLNIKNEAAIAIRKVDATNNNEYLQYAAFQLYRNVNGVYEYVKSATSNGSGYALFSGLEAGSYRIDEVTAPNGYKLWVNPLYFEVKNDLKIAIGNSEYTMVNDVVIVPIANHKANYDFQLRKVDADTRSVLSGATFSLTGTGSVSSYYTTLTSGTSGLTERVSLAKGTYILQELAAPSGYQRTTATFTVVVDDDGVSVDGVRLAGPNVFTYEVENTPTSRTALIYKTDSGTRAPLSGAVFSVTQRGTGNTRTLTTGSNGTTGTITLVPGYSYDIVETATPSGYNRPMQGWTVTISSTGTISVSGRGITAYNDTGRIVINIDNTRATTTTTPGTPPTPTPNSGGSSSGSSSSGSSGSSSGSSSSSTRPSTSSEEPIPLGPGLPRTGQYTNVGLLILGAVIMLISCAALMLYVLKGRREEEGNYDVMSL